MDGRVNISTKRQIKLFCRQNKLQQIAGKLFISTMTTSTVPFAHPTTLTFLLDGMCGLVLCAVWNKQCRIKICIMTKNSKKTTHNVNQEISLYFLAFHNSSPQICHYCYSRLLVKTFPRLRLTQSILCHTFSISAQYLSELEGDSNHWFSTFFFFWRCAEEAHSSHSGSNNR